MLLEKNSFKVIDNFLPENLFYELKEFLHSSRVPWYWNPKETHKSNNKIGWFNFCFYNNDKPDHASFYSHIVPITKMLNCERLIQIRSNLTFACDNPPTVGWHVDYEKENLKTAILYFNNRNGSTLLKTKEKTINVNAAENKLLIFDGSLEHMPIYGDNYTRRIVLNFNFI